jgi:hypothetical protein
VPKNLDAMDIRESSKPKAIAEDSPSTIPADTILASYKAAKLARGQPFRVAPVSDESLTVEKNWEG